MRKYYQVALAFTAIISLTALLFYQHEYNRLRYVLEVINYFGNSESVNIENRQLSPIFMPRNGLPDDFFESTIPSWQRLSDDIFLYSAYRTEDAEVRAIGIAKKIDRSSPLNCAIFWENEIEASTGSVSFEPIALPIPRKEVSENRFAGYIFICKFEEKIPNQFASTIKFATSEESALLPIFDRSTDDFPNKIAGLCVAPPSIARPLIAHDIVRFLSYHNTIGIERFIVYDSGIAPRITNLLKRISANSSSESPIIYTNVPWNFPFAGLSPEIVRQLVEIDCFYRTLGKVDVSTTLNWNEYVVLKYHRNLTSLFADIDKTDFTANRYKLTTLNLCESRSGTIDESEKSIDQQNPIYVYRRKKSVKKFADSLDSRELTSDIIEANRYGKIDCDASEVPLDNRLVGKFSNENEKSPIAKLFKLYNN